jgi:murein DD-endopeptidase MepM/ murein hydrolase activator NlpD
MGIFAVYLMLIASIALVLFCTYQWKQGYVTRIAMLEKKREAGEIQFARLGEEFQSILVLEDKLRTIAGLEPRKETDASAGMGGQEHPQSELPETGEMVSNSADDITPPAFVPGNTTVNVDLFLARMGTVRESFGEILDTFETEEERLSSIPSINPVYSADAWISSGFGYRKDPINGARRFHDGIDIVAPRRTPIIAPADGTVIFAGWRDGLGRMVEIKHDYGYRTKYGHNDKLTVKKGDTVKRGDTIALLGSSGRSTGPHLHYEIQQDGKLLNPYRYVIE